MDITEWLELLDPHATAPLAATVLLADPMPFEYPAKAADLLTNRDPWGASWIAAHRARQAAEAAVRTEPERPQPERQERGRPDTAQPQPALQETAGP